MANRTFVTIVENNIIAGNQSGGIGLTNITEIGGIDDPQDTYSSTESIIRNNRVGVGPNGENIAPDPSDAEARFATGIYAGNGDQVTGNIVANFGGAGVFARASTGRADLPPTQISGNTITNCGMGVQAAHLVGVRVTGNAITDCTRGGVVVTDADVDTASTQSTKLPNPFRQPTRQVSISGNTFTGTTPAVALTADARDLYAGRYTPNQRTVPEDGPNNFQPSPVLVSALRQPDGRIIVTGRAAGAGTLHVHKPEPGKLSPVADVPTDAAAFTSTLPADKAAGLTTITAAVTVGGETSEFGNTIQVRDDDPPPPDTQKPSVTVSAPASGLVVESRAGASVAVAWTSSDNVGVVAQSVRFVGRRGGQPFAETVAASLPGTASSFTLTVRPDDAVADAQIVVEARDAAGNVGEGRSGVFTITAPAPADTQKPTVSNVLLSKKKIVRKTDSTVIISWQSADNVGVVAHDVAFSTDGTTFSVVVAAGLPGDMKAFTWTVPDKATLPKTKTGVVRVTARDAAGNIETATSAPVVVK